MRQWLIALTLGVGIADANAWELTLENQTGRAIISVRVSPYEQGQWGPDLLGNRRLQRGDSITITLSDIQAAPSAGCGTYDIRLMNSDLGTCTLGYQKICADAPRTHSIDEAEYSGCAMVDAFGW